MLPGSLQWSPDSRKLAFVVPGALVIATLPDAATGDSARPASAITTTQYALRHTLTPDPARWRQAVAWSPDSRWIAFISARHTPEIWIADAAGDAAQRVYRDAGDTNLWTTLLAVYRLRVRLTGLCAVVGLVAVHLLDRVPGSDPDAPRPGTP